MQQSILITSTRGPDGIDKNHIAKSLIRWLRRCYLKSAFTGETFRTPCKSGGGSFTGPSCPGNYDWLEEMEQIVTNYLRKCDEVPHHFHLHLIHAAEILGFKHPNPTIKNWWNLTYLRMVNDMHLNHETEEEMDKRLSDVEQAWSGEP
jgi:hypothetical protein